MPLDEEQKKLAAELKVEQGWSYSELGRLFSMSKGNVYKQVKPAVEEYGGEEGGEAEGKESRVGTEEWLRETQRERNERKRAGKSSGASTESSRRETNSKYLLLILLWIVGILLVVVGIA